MELSESKPAFRIAPLHIYGGNAEILSLFPLVIYVKIVHIKTMIRWFISIIFPDFKEY